MTTDIPLRVEHHDTVATIEFERPPSNFFDSELIAAIADALDDLAADGTCRAVVLQSAGRQFCAGADFSNGPLRASGPHVYDVAVRLFEQPLPLVAAVQGAAIGGGLGLALAADFRVGAPEARFAANFATIGLHHGFGLTVTLPRLIGNQAALNLLLTGRRVPGEEALELGLLDRLVPLDELRDAALALATEIAVNAPLALRSIRATMRQGLATGVAAAMQHERAEQMALIDTEDFRQGTAAAKERRTPHFVGR